MSYSKQELDRLVQSVLQIAKDNLLKDGYVQPVGLLFGTTGLRTIFPMKFSGLEGKRAIQAEFRALTLKTEALAAVVVNESWFRTPTPEQPLDQARSVAEYADRMECIIVEAVSPQAKALKILIFDKSEDGQFRFGEPFEPEYPMSWKSEWLDGVWDQNEEGEDHGISSK